MRSILALFALLSLLFTAACAPDNTSPWRSASPQEPPITIVHKDGAVTVIPPNVHYYAEPAKGVRCAVIGDRDSLFVTAKIDEQGERTSSSLFIYAANGESRPEKESREIILYSAVHGTTFLEGQGYSVFSVHCAEIAKQLPADIRARFHGHYGVR